MHMLQKDVYVLGVHDGHNAGAAIIKNGIVIAAINEERLTLIKNQADTPALSILKVIELAKIQPSDIHIVAVSSYIRVVRDPNIEKKLFLFKLHMAVSPFLHSKWFIKYAVKVLAKLTHRNDLITTLKTIGIAAPIIFVEHHLTHAACAYYQRPWKEKTLVFTLDGMGDGLSATVSIGDGTKLTRIAASSYYDSLGSNIYAEITRYLGMRRGEHEYKVMGLAPYGDYTQTIEVFKKVMRLNPSNPLEFQNNTWRYMETLEPIYQKYLKYKRFDHVAAGAQRFYEDLVCKWVQEAISRTGIRKIACSGGSFLNVKANMRVRKLPEVDDLFIYPAADDGGMPVGAAFFAYGAYCQQHHMVPTIQPIGAIYYGQKFSNEQIEEFIKVKKLTKKTRKAEAKEIAKLLSSGKIIARFAGHDEWGPRALGNRSIMADPRHWDITYRLNQAIKQRDFWMPFAPAILEDDQKYYLKQSHFAPYMTEAFETTEKGAEISATVHPADKTTRPMTVNDWNPSWQELIRAFKKETGVGAVLNTSFNLHGYPLVSTPDQALWTFQHSDLDGLLLNDWLVIK